MQTSNKNISIISKDCSLNGNLNFKGNLILAGSIKGTLHAERAATEKDSYINGKAMVNTFIIGGFFEGEITATESLTLLPTAIVNGLVKYRTITIEKGCTINGTLKPLSPGSGS